MAAPRAVCHPARLVLFPVLFPPSGGKGQGIAKEQAEGNEERENQCEGFRRPLRQFLDSLLFRLLPPPSTPSPAAHPLTQSHPVKGMGGHPAPALGDVIATTSPPINQQLTANKVAAPRNCLPSFRLLLASLCPLPDVLPAILPASSPLPGGEW